MADQWRYDDDGRPIESSRTTGQDQYAKEAKSGATQLLNLLRRKKGKSKDAGDRENAAAYFKGLDERLTVLFRSRWVQSSAEPLWNEFVRVWNDGACKWSDACEAFEPLNDALQQSD